jgi:hypothetical protein
LESELRKIKKIKFAVIKKVLTFAVPKERGEKKRKPEANFGLQN